MRRLRSFDHRVYRTPDGRRLMGYARAQLVPDGPEEYVRQDVLRTLVEEYGYPRLALLAEEPVARGTKNRRRADVLVELPSKAHRQHRARVGQPKKGQPDEVPPYSNTVATLEARLGGKGGIRFVATPDEMDLTVDGESVRCRMLGYKEEDHALSLWLKPPRAVQGLPDEFGIHVLGWGMTSEERRIAGPLGLDQEEYTDPDRETFSDDCGFLFDLDVELDVSSGGCIPKSSDAGWMVLRPIWTNQFGALAYIDVATDEWSAFLRERIPHWPGFPVGEGNVAYRDDLESLDAGDQVYVALDGFDRFVPGVVKAAAKDEVSVDCKEGPVISAKRSLVDPQQPFLLGRVESARGDDVALEGGAEDRGKWKTFIVVECKAPTVSFSEEIKEQGLHYAKVRGAQYLVLTNGRWTVSYYLANGEVTEVEEIPDYEAALSNDDFEVSRLKPDPPHVPLPPDADDRPDAVRLHARYRACIGADVPRALWQPILVVDDALQAPEQYVDQAFSGYGVTIAEDLGLRWHEPGNVAGGTFPGLYRDFLLSTPKRKELIFGLRVSQSLKTRGHKSWGNRTGISHLTCCLSFGAVYQPVLEYRLNRFIKVDAKAIRFWHSGAATVGKGAVKNAVVVDFIESRQPALVDEGRIDLGAIPNSSGAGWDDIKDWVARMAGYVLLRHEFKEKVRAKRRRRTK